jgi:hypothetical protein
VNRLTELGKFDCRDLAGAESLLAAIGSYLPEAWVSATFARCASALAFPKIPFTAGPVEDGVSVASQKPCAHTECLLTTRLTSLDYHHTPLSASSGFALDRSRHFVDENHFSRLLLIL